MAENPVKIVHQDIKKLETEALVVFFFKDIRPLKGIAGEIDWLLCGSLSALLLGGKLQGVLGDVALLTSQGKLPAQKIFLMGLGPQSDFSPATMRKAAGMAADGALRAGVRFVAIECIQREGLSEEECVAALRQGLHDGSAGRGLNVAVLASHADALDKISGFVPTA